MSAGVPAIRPFAHSTISDIKLFASHICVLVSLGDSSVASVSSFLKQ